MSGGAPAPPDLHPVVREELELLARVRGALAGRTNASTPSETGIVRELERLREQLLARGEGADPLLLAEWHRENALLRQLRSAREAPQVDPGSPYFAHLRLREADGERELCLGRATCVEQGLRIVDWRHAPVSRIFYRYEQGEQYEEEVAGRLRRGEVVARRTVAIRDGVLERVEAPEGVFVAEGPGWRRVRREPARLCGGEASAVRAYDVGDPRAAAARARQLGAGRAGAVRADKHLSEITSLIDPAQFDLISRPGAGYLAIRGTAGSGKTTVALHRIAYLAYADPAIDSEETLCVVFSPALRSYVAHVLPALDVHRVTISTWREWAAAQRRRHFPRLPAEVREDTPASVQRLKLHPALATALALHVRRTPGPATREQALDDWASALVNRRLLEEVFSGGAGPPVGKENLRRFVEWQRRALELLDAWREGDDDARAELDAEDDALLLRAWQLRVGPLHRQDRAALRYRHVAVDEVQDFAPVEVCVLLACLDPRGSITLAGDTQQHVHEHGGFTSWSAFLNEVGLSGSEVRTLRISYRSSQPIVAFALALLGELREDEEPPLAPRPGPPVELFRFTDRGACVAFLTDALRGLARREPLASVAVLTPSPALSEAYYRGLTAGDLPRLRRVEDQDFTFAPGIEVTEIGQAKGLEFDYVVLADVDGERFPADSAARRRLHVGATRAVHQLWLTCVGTPSGIVTEAMTAAPAA